MTDFAMPSMIQTMRELQTKAGKLPSWGRRKLVSAALGIDAASDEELEDMFEALKQHLTDAGSEGWELEPP